MPASNECLSKDDVAEEVANGNLVWKNSQPTLGQQVVTRSWFNTYVLNDGSVPADGKLMTWGEMLAAAVVGAHNLQVADESYCDPVKGARYAARLTWTNVPNSGSIAIYRNGSYVTTVPAGTESYYNSLSSGGSYTYQLYDQGTGTWSNEASIWLDDPCLPS